MLGRIWTEEEQKFIERGRDFERKLWIDKIKERIKELQKLKPNIHPDDTERERLRKHVIWELKSLIKNKEVKE